jgi:DedD protein
MATPASTEASEIRRRGRRRLIGAVTLVVLAVVFVPMILDSEPRPKRNDVSLEIPAKDKVPPLPPPSTKAQSQMPVKAPEPGPAVVEKSTTPAKAPEKATPAKAATPAPSNVTPGAATPQRPGAQEPVPPKLEGFAVQVGAFRDEEKLKQAREKLAAAGLPHFVERRGDLNRLRAGPYPTREAAEKALAAVKAASLDGQVVPLP